MAIFRTIGREVAGFGKDIAGYLKSFYLFATFRPIRAFRLSKYREYVPQLKTDLGEIRDLSRSLIGIEREDYRTEHFNAEHKLKEMREKYRNGDSLRAFLQRDSGNENPQSLMSLLDQIEKELWYDYARDEQNSQSK